jgi:hypothetical protein
MLRLQVSHTEEESMQLKLARALAITAVATLVAAAPSLAGTTAQASVTAAAPTPSGLGAPNLQSAYGLPSGLGTGSTVAVVTAFDDSSAGADLTAYRSQYSLSACSTGCFTKVNQTGGTNYPAAEATWTVPAAESLDAISAVCPNCTIILVEADSDAVTDLGAADNEAVTLGADFIDNDWYIPEAEVGAVETTYDTDYFNHPGIAITAPAGDSGYGINYPAASPYVTAVGGTVLTADSGVARGWDESAWADSGSGCSAYEPKPSWQADTGCSGRMANDVSAVATNVAYYNTSGTGGWGVGSGTAISAAIVAAAYALAGAPAPGTNPASYLYDHPLALNAITTGSNGTCTPTYLCTAGADYNGPAGQGTPHGGSAFHTVGAKPPVITATGGKTWTFATTTTGDIDASSLPSGSSTWSTLTSLGGGPWPTYPSALAASNGSVWVFATKSGSLYGDNLPSGSTTWSGWADLGNDSATLIGTPTAARATSGTIDVFARGAAAGQVHEIQLPSGSTTWSSFTNLGGNFPDDISAEVGSGGTIHLAGAGYDSVFYLDTLPTTGSWSGWTAVPGASVTGVPTTLQDANDSSYRVWVRRTTDGSIVGDGMASGATTWGGWASRGGFWTTDPTGFPGTGGVVWLLAINVQLSINLDNLATSGGWSGWGTVNTGNCFTGVAGFTEDTSGNFHLVGRSCDGQLKANEINSGSSTWQGWTTIGGPLAGT